MRGNCRSICCLCQEVYCTLCRPIPCTKGKCPNGHGFVYTHGSYNDICDSCGLKPKVVGEAVYDDVRCNFLFCKPCYEALPETR